MALIRRGKSRNSHVDNRDLAVFDRWMLPHIGGHVNYRSDGSVEDCGLIIARDGNGEVYGYSPCGKCDLCDAARHFDAKKRLYSIWEEDIARTTDGLPCDVHFIIEDTSSIHAKDPKNPLNKLKRFLANPSNLIVSFTSCRVFYVAYGEHRADRRHLHVQFVSDTIGTQAIRRVLLKVGGTQVNIRSEQETNSREEVTTVQRGKRKVQICKHKDIVVDGVQRRVINPTITMNDIVFRGAYILRGANQIENNDDAVVTTRTKSTAFYLHRDLSYAALAEMCIDRLAYKTIDGIVEVPSAKNGHAKLLLDNIETLRRPTPIKLATLCDELEKIK